MTEEKQKTESNASPDSSSAELIEQTKAESLASVGVDNARNAVAWSMLTAGCPLPDAAVTNIEALIRSILAERIGLASAVFESRRSSPDGTYADLRARIDVFSPEDVEMTIGSGIHPATVTWLIKGTLAMVDISGDPNLEPEARFLVGPDGLVLLGGEMVHDDPILENNRLAWVQHPDTIREAREAWLAAGGRS